MAAPDQPSQPLLARRNLLIGGGVGVGLIVAWAAWPRRYAANLTAAKGEHIFNAWLKIGEDGHVAIAVPQAEHGQGVWTTLPQIVADELGADWRTVAVEAAPLNPLYANPMGATELFEGAFERVPEGLRARHVTERAMMLTVGSTSVRQFESDLRDAGAAARVLLQKAAARRWGTDWQACGTADGFVVHGKDRLRFGELAAEAIGGGIPNPIPWRGGEIGRLSGQSLPRLDSPAKVDGAVNFAADVRLPDMAFAAIRQGPTPDSVLIGCDTNAANRIRGVTQIVQQEHWIAAIANNWWAADRAIDTLSPRFRVPGPPLSTTTIDRALDSALKAPGARMASAGDVGAAFKGATVVTAEYRADVALHASVETRAATAAWSDGVCEVWTATQAPGLARDAVASATGVPADSVVIHPMPIGGGFGINLEHDAAVQAAVLAQLLKRPIQVMWSRGEDCQQDKFRAPAAARMAGRLDNQGRITGWLAKIAAPATGRELAHRLLADDRAASAALALSGSGDGYAVAGAAPLYQIPSYAVDHHEADVGVPTGHWRSGSHSYTCFFTECFIDELAHVAGTEAMSFRIGMLGGNARLARCLTTVAGLGGWEGGVPGSGQGIACHSFRGSHIAVFAEAHIDEDQSIGVDRIVAAVDCGRTINPDVVRQNIEGGLVFGMAMALGASTKFKGNLVETLGFGGLDLPRLADMPDITVELIPSEADPGGVSELAVPPVAPAIANALQSATGFRIRTLPLRVGDA
ncbi:xanthine dehydrogenase family protein molybdopterin-binding subunit [Sphingomonas sp.]|jgi:isoquinoline 1-oxidoreductase beta subunit|uniref:xanthine dehydrogenase family protein molybdopterin-binding subunit n=1 Tax=Sphingomonas sp. TaxID=28214 RepID=UPI002E32BCAE|nr:molybdopterin cofactor-binding domain-containing protein [Sphingomonas sp.]HEX4694358.1 molybdopterin cofactor-binding domain-containing protein [Sphingomonas sp.]